MNVDFSSLTDRTVEGDAKTFSLYLILVDPGLSIEERCKILDFPASDVDDALDAIADALVENPRWFPAKLFCDKHNYTHELSDMMFDRGFIKLTKIENDNMKNINENTKVTLTVEQLKKLVNEYEHYYDPETGRTYDDEGNSWYGPPNPKYDVSDTPWRPRYGGYSSRRSSWGGYSKKKYNSPKEIESDKFFGNNPPPKSEGQAIWHLYQMVCIADDAKKAPQEVPCAAVINRMIDCLKALGMWSPNGAEFDKMTAGPLYYFPNDTIRRHEVPKEVVQKLKDAILSGDVSKLNGRNYKFAGRAKHSSQSYEWLYKDIKASFEYDDVLAAFGIYDAYGLRKIMLDYYKQDKANRDASNIKADMNKWSKGTYAENLLKHFLDAFDDFKSEFELDKEPEEPSEKNPDAVADVNENTKVTLTLKQLKKLVRESAKTPIKENGLNLADFVLEDPQVQAASEHFANCLVEDVVEQGDLNGAIQDYITTGTVIRFRKLKDAIKVAMDKYRGAR